MEQSNRKTPAVFIVGMVLFCLVIISSHLTGGLYARYATSATGGDAARVAVFNVLVTSNETLVTDSTLIDLGEMQPNQQGKTITFTVNNQSEVTVEFLVTVENVTQNLPIDVEGSGVGGQLEPGASGTYAFSVLWRTGAANTDPKYAGQTDLLKLSVVARQVD